jgi:hypothetical protein
VTRWFATDRDGFMAVFEGDETAAVPKTFADPERGDALTRTISRELRREMLPVVGSHVNVRAGTVLMRGEAGQLRSWALRVEPLRDGAFVVSFPLAPRGRPATFMPSIRTFGAGDDPPSAFEQVHSLGLCGGCSMDLSDGDFDNVGRFAALGFFVYVASEEPLAGPYQRIDVPAQPLHSKRISKIARGFAKFTGAFATDQLIQPLEHWEKVEVDAVAWLGSDGTVRCVPGRARDYAHEYTYLVDEYASVEKP